MPIIAISGSQGQGKSTVLASLGELGYNILPHKTSRSILNEWGYTLNDLNKDFELKKKFQEECLIRHKQYCTVNDDKLYFTERSFADIFVYALFSLGIFNEYDEWISDFYHKCKVAQRETYKNIIYLAGNNIKAKDDGTRSTNYHFGMCVDWAINHYLIDFDVKMLTLESNKHTDRLEQIEWYVSSYVEED